MGRKNYFEAETAVSLRQLQKENKEFMYFRIPDTNMQRAVSSKIIAIKTPCDYLAVYKGKTYFLECKSTKRKLKSYSLGYIRPHQLEYLLKVEECGGRGWFLLNNRGVSTNIYAYAISPHDIKRWIDSGLKSVKWERIKQVGMPLKRASEGGRGVWNLRCLFNMRKE